ncbi:hypothetical protein FB451DRAFT_1401289 [Mycena latifolia]|nr:hypothetical protein FB451DRAFT_1401289 [Mycena latifolia]
MPPPSVAIPPLFVRKRFLLCSCRRYPRAKPQLSGVQAKLLTDNCEVQLSTFSKLANREKKGYGISHIDVRFAIQVETEFAKNWARSAQNITISNRKVPTTMEEVWNYHSLSSARSLKGQLLE